MRIARTLLLAALAVAATMAMTASSASAVTVTNEATGGPCSAVTASGHTVSGGCFMDAESEDGLHTELTGPFGIMFTCENHFQGRVNGAGEGFVYNQAIHAENNPAGSCGIDPCGEESGERADPWPAHLNTATTMEVVFCVVGSFGIIQNCHLTLSVNQITHTTGEVRDPNASGHAPCEAGNAVNGHWLVTSPAPGFEIN